MIDGEKWFVTYGDVAAVYIVMANALVDGERAADAVPRRRARRAASRSSTTRPSPTPTRTATRPIRFTGVEVGEDAVIGGLGGGDDLQRAWFTEERLGIAARGVGSMWRLIEETTAWALEREQGGNRIMDYQGVSFPLADSAADAAAGRLLTLEVARLADAGADPKVVHAKASMAKLFVSEAACRCADRCVQIFGGRGYMRTNVAERFLPRAARGPHLGGHQRDPAADRGPRARAARGRAYAPLGGPAAAPPAHGRGGRRDRPARVVRRRDAAEPARARLRRARSGA